MANYAILKAAIQDVVKTNGNNEITGALLQQSLLAMINSLGENFQFVGIATPETIPGIPDQNIFYLAGPGTYPNFGNTVVGDGAIGIFTYNTIWNYSVIPVLSASRYVEKSYNLAKELNAYFDIEPNLTYYLDRNGVVQHSNTVNSYGVTDFIPVDLVRGLFATGTLNSSAVSGCAVYDSNKTFLRNATNTPEVKQQLYIKRDGDAYVRFTLYAGTSIRALYSYPFGDIEETIISGYPADKLTKGAKVGGVSLFDVKPKENLLNPLNVIYGNGLYFTSTGTLNVAGSAQTSGVTGFIPFGDLAQIKIFGQTVHSGSIRNCVYDENFQFVRAQTGSTITKGDGEFYVRFTIKSSTTDLMVCAASYNGDFVAYEEDIVINPAFIKRMITVDDITPTEIKYLSNNICDPSECYFGNDKYINRSTGAIGSFTSSGIGGYTGFIPIDEKGITFGNIYYSGTAIGGAVYDANFVYRRSAGASGIVTYQPGDAYVRFTLAAGATAQNVMVNQGTALLPYVPYAGKTTVISKDILPDFSSEQPNTYLDGVEIVLPNEFVVVRGDNWQMFYRSIVKSVNPFAFDLLATCGNGAPFPRYLQLKTAYNNNGSVGYLSIGTRTLTMRVRDNQTRLIGMKSATIRIIAPPVSPSSTKRILVIGASTIANGATTNEVKRRLVETTGVELTAANISNNSYFANPKGLGLGNIQFVGRQTSQAGVKQDGVAGRKMQNVATAGTNLYTFYFPAGTNYDLIQGSVYSHNGLQFTVQGSDITSGDLECTLTSGSGSPLASGTLTLVSGEGSQTVEFTSVNIENSNPFWDPSNNRVSFALYSANYCDGENIDIVVSHLGINDIFSPNETIDDLINYTKTFIRAFHSDFPNGKFIITTLVLPDITGGMGSSYPGSYANTYWNIASLYFEYNKALFDLVADSEFSGYVLLCTSLAEFDNENLFIHTSRPTSNRSAVNEQIGTNALHYSTPGFNTVADSIYHYVCHALNQLAQ